MNQYHIRGIVYVFQRNAGKTSKTKRAVSCEFGDGCNLRNDELFAWYIKIVAKKKNQIIINDVEFV